MATYTYEFNASNSIQKFTVPEGILNLHVTCIAPKGKNTSDKVGGKGGCIECDVRVSPNQNIYVVAGMTNMNYNASDIRTNNAGITDSNSLKSRIVVAGGGGSAGYAASNGYGKGGSADGGDGGNPAKDGKNATGSSLATSTSNGGKAGTINSGGAGGTSSDRGYYGSKWFGKPKSGTAGTLGLGGNGGYIDPDHFGGKGGAGWYGGGGGATSSVIDYGKYEWDTGAFSAAGGGGGSSYAAGFCSNISYEGENNTENGKVIITHGEPILPEPIKAKTNRIITYTDLIADYLYWLQFNCANIDGYSSAVTDPFLSGYSNVIPGTNISIKIIENTVIPTITYNECKNEIDTYMEQCGLLTGENTIIKTVDILKYYNALASFSAAKLVTVSSQFANAVLTMYKKSNTVSPISLPTNVLPVNNDIKNLATEFINLINKTTKMHVITYTIG